MDVAGGCAVVDEFRSGGSKLWVEVVSRFRGLGNTVGWVVSRFGIRDKRERERDRDDEVEREWSEMGFEGSGKGLGFWERRSRATRGGRRKSVRKEERGFMGTGSTEPAGPIFFWTSLVSSFSFFLGRFLSNLARFFNLRHFFYFFSLFPLFKPFFCIYSKSAKQNKIN